MLFFLLIIPILACTVSLSFVYASWSNSNSKEQFFNSLKYSTLISLFILLIGYIYTALAPKIFIQ